MKNKEQLKKQSKATASFKQYKKDVYLQTITRTVTPVSYTHLEPFAPGHE